MIRQMLEGGNGEESEKDPSGGQSKKELSPGMHGHKSGKNRKVHLLGARERLRFSTITKCLKKQGPKQDQPRVENAKALPTEAVLHLASEVIEHHHLEEEPDRGGCDESIGGEPPDLAVRDGCAAVNEKIQQSPVARSQKERSRDHGSAMDGHQQGDQTDGKFPKIKEGVVLPGKYGCGHA